MADDFLTIPHVKTKDLARFFSKIHIDRAVPFNGSPCWLWTAGKTPCGYAQTSIKSYPVLVHRLMYAWLVGPLPKGLKQTLDHLCRIPHCCNPCHLELVSCRVNVLRGVGPSASNARQTHCRQGHALSGANLYTKPNGERVCKECRRKWGNDRNRNMYANNPEYREMMIRRSRDYKKQTMKDPLKVERRRAQAREYRRVWRLRKKQERSEI